MNHQHRMIRVRPIFAGLVCAVACIAPANGQPPNTVQSHGHIPGKGMVDRSQLADRLTQARLAADLGDLVRKSHADPKFLHRLQENPEQLHEIEHTLREIMKKQGGSLGQLQPDDPLVKNLQGLVRDWGGEGRIRPPEIDSDLWNQLKKAAQPPQSPPATPHENASLPAPPNGNHLPQSGQPPSSTPSPSRPPEPVNPFAASLSNSMNDRFLRWAQRTVEQNPRLRDSKTVKAVLAEFDRFRLREALSGDFDENSFTMQLAQGVKGLMPSREFLSDNLRPMLEKLPRPKLPSIQLPNIDLPRPTFPAVDLPAPSMPAPTGEQLGLGFVAIFLIIGLFILGNRLVQRGRGGVFRIGDVAKANLETVRLDLTAPINTREDLVRAFEELSITKLGTQAQNWNHRTIAEEFGGYAVNRRRVATHLASLYETARYTPANEELPSESLRTAQREIAYLAGVSEA